jgi:CubicO group peptidase (beta-lactamase class C family)
MSSTKSISNLLIGILIDQGRVRLDDSVSRFIPQWKAGAAAGVTIRHLLSMTSGIPDNRSVQDVGTVEDKEALVFGMALATTPGSTWAYSNNGAFLLSPIIKAAAGESVASFAERNLFQPLGMRDTRMHVYPEGQAWTHADMETTPGDLARIGQLMLDRGVWRGRRIVSSQWVDSSLTRSQAQVPYGLMWWLNIPNGFAARGYRETNVYVFPRQELVIVRMQNNSSESYTRYEEQALRIFARLASTVR